MRFLVPQCFFRHLEQRPGSRCRVVGGTKVERHLYVEVSVVLFLRLQCRLGRVPFFGRLTEVVEELIGRDTGRVVRAGIAARAGGRKPRLAEPRQGCLIVRSLLEIRCATDLWQKRGLGLRDPGPRSFRLSQGRVQLGLVRARQVQSLVQGEHARFSGTYLANKHAVHREGQQ